MALAPEETDLIGNWVPREDRVVADETTRRIDELISSELRWLANSSDGWDALYQDPRDGRYWERTYPNADWHGGGPPRLRCIAVEDARSKYGSFS